MARVEAALVAARDGPHGVAVAAARLEVRAGQLALSVVRYRAADRLGDEAEDLRRWLLGAAAPLALPLLPVTVTAGVVWAGATLLSGGDPAAALSSALTDHPGVVDEVVGAVPGLTAPLRSGLLGPLPVVGDQVFRATTGQSLLPGSLEEAAGLLALLYTAAPPVVTTRPDTSPRATAVPVGVGDLLARLDWRNRQAVGERQGDLGVTRIVTTGADGHERVSYVVDVPGTKSWQPTPGADRPHVNDLASNLELMAGLDNARVEALGRVLERVGVQPGEPVLLTGHSQGGLVAMRAAQQLGDRFTITHVVTAGSPVGGMAVPEGTSVLSLENAHDVVPHLDGVENEPTARHTTVVFADQQGSIGANHGTSTSYVPAARALDLALDATAAESVEVWLDSAHAFTAGRGETHVATTTVATVDGRVAR